MSDNLGRDGTAMGDGIKESGFASTNSMVATHGLPGDFFAVAEKLAGEFLVGFGGEPDSGVGTFRDGAGCGGSAHIGPDPAGAHGVHCDVMGLQGFTEDDGDAI